MKKLLDLQGRTYDAEVAREVARQLQESDQDWSYVAEINGQFGRVVVFDENGERLGVY